MIFRCYIFLNEFWMEIKIILQGIQNQFLPKYDGN